MGPFCSWRQVLQGRSQISKTATILHLAASLKPLRPGSCFGRAKQQLALGCALGFHVEPGAGLKGQIQLGKPNPWLPPPSFGKDGLRGI